MRCTEIYQVCWDIWTGVEGGGRLSLHFYYIYHYEMTVGKYFTILTISELQNSFLNQGQTVTGPGGC